MWIFILSLLVKTSESFQVEVKVKYFSVYVFSCHLSSGKWLPIAVERSSIASFCRWPSPGLLALTNLFSIYAQGADPWPKHRGAKPPKIIIFPTTLCGDVLASSMEQQFTRAPMTDQRSPPSCCHIAAYDPVTDGWLSAALPIRWVPSKYCPYNDDGERVMPTTSIQPKGAPTDALAV